MDEEGNVIAKHRGSQDAVGFKKTIAKGTEFIDVKTKATNSDKVGKFDVSMQIKYLIARWELGNTNTKDAKKELDEFKSIPKSEEKIVNEFKINMKANSIFKDTNWKDKDAAEDAQKELYKMYKDEQIPTSEGDLSPFWNQIMTYAEKEIHADAFEKALNYYKELAGSNPNFKKWFEDKEKVLIKLKKAEKEEKKD